VVWVFSVWGDALSGRQVLVGSILVPCHLWEFLYMRSAGMCVWWRCVWVDRYYVLTLGSGGVCSNKNSSDFRLLTLWSVDGCRIACCVHHSVFPFAVAEGILRAGTEREICPSTQYSFSHSKAKHRVVYTTHDMATIHTAPFVRLGVNYIYIHSYTLLRRGAFSSICKIQPTTRSCWKFRICTYTVIILCKVFFYINFCDLKMAHSGRNMSLSA